MENSSSLENKNTTSYRILAQDEYIENDNQLKNQNDCIIGSSGAGKTFSYCIPNLLSAKGDESFVVEDTKGSLMQQLKPILERRGYTVLQIDFKNMNSTCRWNPLEYISYDECNDCYSERDIAKISKALCPITDKVEVIWDELASQLCSTIIAWVMANLPESEHNLESVSNILAEFDTPECMAMFQQTVNDNPDSTASRWYKRIESNRQADKFWASIKGILSNDLQGVCYDSAIQMYNHENRFQFSDLGNPDKPVVLFVNVSDTDRSMDALVGLFFQQAFEEVCNYADRECPGQRLPIRLRFILDDFATNYVIPEFDKTISICRSRNISVSIILQSITQLNSMYGRDSASSIIDSCENILYLGGQSLDTAEYMGIRLNLQESTVLNMPLDDAYLLIRGQEPRKVHRFDIRTHENYQEFIEARRASMKVPGTNSEDNEPTQGEI